MKRLIRRPIESASNVDLPKLKRTPESGHSCDRPVTFNSFEDYKKWWEEDALYEDED